MRWTTLPTRSRRAPQVGAAAAVLDERWILTVLCKTEAAATTSEMSGARDEAAEKLSASKENEMETLKEVRGVEGDYRWSGR
jgi:hypothetical protein